MSLAITEKRQQRPAGCAGILFHFFDWNRRLAKKKLKLLPPVRARAAKRDDKMIPVANKFLLIADENRGGFPAAKKPEVDHTDGMLMRSPGLVARLMGLDSMPAVSHTKPPKGLNSEKFDVHGRSCEYHWQDQEIGSDSRPQKLQKTGGFLERRVAGAAWFSPPDVLRKNAVSRTKKQHHKLASPVKSPQTLSSSSTARLMQAATKILEPRLQSRSRARCAITYTGSLQDNADRFDAESSFNGSRGEPTSDSLIGSGRTCGGPAEVSESRLGTREPVLTDSQPSASDYSNAANFASSSHDGSKEGKMKTPPTPGGRVRTASLAVQPKLNVQKRASDFTERKHHSRNNQDQCKPWQDVSSSPALKNSCPSRYQLPLVRDREVRATRPSNNNQSGKDTNDLNGAKNVHARRPSNRNQSGRDTNNLNGDTKNFVSLNRNLNDCSRTRSATKLSNNLGLETARNGWDKNSGCKRRPTSCPQIENVGGINTTLVKQRSVRTGLINRKEAGVISTRSINRNGTGSELPKKTDIDGSGGSKNNGIVSFTFSSRTRHGSTSSAHQETKEKNRAHGASCYKLASDTKAERLTLRGDELSDLLEQKIKLLSSLDRDDSETVDALPAISTATILEELISALTTEAPSLSEKSNSCSGGSSQSENSCRDGSDQSDCTISQDQMLTIKEKFQEDANTDTALSFLMGDSDRPSPTSILEASFSNDSCSVGSPCSSGSILPLDFNTDVMDSAIPTRTKELDLKKIPHCYARKTCSSLRDAGFSEAKVNHACQAISKALHLFENTSLYTSHGTLGPSIDAFLLRILETTLQFAEEENQLRDLLFDCIIEYFDSKYGCFCMSGYRAWSKLPAFLRRDQLLREVDDEIRGWGDLAGKDVDYLIGKEIRVSTTEWTEFENEGFDTGIEVENEILQALVDEMVVDLCLC